MNWRETLFGIIEPSEGHRTKYSAAYDIGMLIMIVLSLVPICFVQQYRLFTVTDALTTAIFLLDYLARWLTADLRRPKLGKKVFLLYPFTIHAVIDFFSISPAFFPFSKGLKLLRLVRLIRAIRVFQSVRAFRTKRVERYTRNSHIVTEAIRRERDALIATCGMALGYILICAMVMFSVEPESFGSFFDAVYWSVVTLTTVGYGDVYPISTVGKFIAMLSSLVGIAIVALPTGIITAGYMEVFHEYQDQKKE